MLSGNELLSIFFSNVGALVVFDKKFGYVEYVNQKGSELFQFHLLKEEGAHVRDLCSRPDLFNGESALNFFHSLPEGRLQTISWPVRLPATMWLEADVTLVKCQGKELVVAEYRDATEERESQKKLKSMVSFRELLDELFYQNTIVSVENIPQLIQSALSRVGHFFDCDRSYIFEFSENQKYKSNTFEWCADGVVPYKKELQHLPIRSYPYFAEYFLNLRTFCLTDINELPDSANAERFELAKEGIQSLLIIPFGMGERPLGFIGLDHVRSSKRWTSVEISNLKLMARAIASMLIRYKDGQQIKEQKHFYQTLFDAANDSIGIIKNGILIDTNPKSLMDFRCQKKDVVGKTVVELSASNQQFGRTATYAYVVLQKTLNGEPQVFDWRLRRPDGSEFFAKMSLNRFYLKNEMCVIAIFRDITEHKQQVNSLQARQQFLSRRIERLVEPALKEEQLTLADLFDLSQLKGLQDAFSDAMGISSVITDANGKPLTSVSLTNRICKMVRETGQGREMCFYSGKVLGQQAHKLKKPYSQVCYSCGLLDAAAPIIVDNQHIGNWLIGQVLPDHFDANRLLAYTQKLGLSEEEVKGELRKLTPVPADRLEKILNLLHLLTDELSTLGYNNLKLAKTIRGHVVLEEKLILAKQKAEESDRLKTAFLANLSHEIRTPMNGIIGFSELLRYEGLNPVDRKEYIRLIHQSSNQLLSIINDIIDVSKIEAGQVDVSFTSFDLNDVFKEMESFFDPLATAKDIHLIYEAEGSISLTSDEIKLRQILTNLISNAIKFTNEGNVTFGGTADMATNKVTIYVQDTGVGIENEDLENIFDRFWQAKDDDVKKGGTGLGLAITKAYVELLGGHIYVESKDGEGSRFYFALPAKPYSEK